MENWQKINLREGARIEKLINEYNIGELIKTPWSKFKIRIYKRQNGTYRGLTNLMYKNNGEWQTGHGEGNSELEALERTLEDFMLKLSSFNEKMYDDDFDVSDFFKPLSIYEF